MLDFSRLCETVLHRCFSITQAQEDLRLKNTTDMSADLKDAEMTIQQMSAEIEALTEKVKVGFQPGILNYTHVDSKDLCIYH